MVISTKELNSIEQLLSWEQLAAKKCNLYAEMETHPAQKSVFTVTGNMHRRNYNRLIGYLNAITSR